MHRVSFVLTLIAALVLPLGAQAEELSRTITVVGEAEEQVVPDRARVSAGVVSRGRTADEGLAQNNSAMEKVLGVLDAAGIKAADVGTSGFGVSPLFEETTGPRQARRIVGYQVTNTVTVLLRDIDKVGAVLDALVNAGANNLHGVTFFAARDTARQDRLRIAAVKEARRKAMLMAEAAGAEVGRVVTISEAGGGTPFPVARLQAEASSRVPVAPGSQTIATTVTVAFELR